MGLALQGTDVTCGRPPSVCPPALGVLLLLLALAGCGGGSPAPRTETLPEPEPGVLLFQDDFVDEAVSTQRWTPSEPAAPVDPDTGTLQLGNQSVTANAPPFARGSGELELLVTMSWPAWCSVPDDHDSRPIQLVSMDTSAIVASLVVIASPDCTTVVEYRIDPTGSPSPSSVVNPQTFQPFDLADGLHQYRIHILDDGRATWYRDGIALITSFVPLSDSGYALRLEGIGVGGAPNVVFDDVEVLTR